MLSQKEIRSSLYLWRMEENERDYGWYILILDMSIMGLFGWWGNKWGKWGKFTPNLPLRCQTCAANVVGQMFCPPNSIYP
jgi:hypothetical protein